MTYYVNVYTPDGLKHEYLHQSEADARSAAGHEDAAYSHTDIYTSAANLVYCAWLHVFLPLDPQPGKGDRCFVASRCLDETCSTRKTPVFHSAVVDLKGVHR